MISAIILNLTYKKRSVYKLFFFTLITLHSCQSESSTKKAPAPSPPPVEEHINQLEVMSTPPQKWRLEIGSGQKEPVTQNYLLKNIQWHNESWQFTSASAKQENNSSAVFIFEAIYGETTPQHLRLIANQSTFNTTKGLLEGKSLIIKAHNENWEILAKDYRSEYPWSTLKLQQVKGKFKR